MMLQRRVGLLGGMFDPIHRGHLDLAMAAQAALHLTEVLILPSNIPPHRPQPYASSYHRFAMAAMAVAGQRGWRALDLELQHDGPSYTSETLRRFHENGYPAGELVFITGADAFLEIAGWHDYPGVIDLAHFAVVARPGTLLAKVSAALPGLASRMRRLDGTTRRHMGVVPRLDSDPAQGTSIFLIDAVTADVSSTAIRAARQLNRPIAGFVPVSVRQHIEQHGLYQDFPRQYRVSPDPGGATAGRLHGQD